MPEHLLPAVELSGTLPQVIDCSWGERTCGGAVGILSVKGQGVSALGFVGRLLITLQLQAGFGAHLAGLGVGTQPCAGGDK